MPLAPGNRLVVVRHGATAWATAGRHTGRTDIPLDARGEAQARALGPRLEGRPFETVLCSPLSRARLTSALAGFADRARPCDDLLEWDYGDYEGLTTDEIRAERPGWTLWDDGVPGGESIEQVARRARRVLETVHHGRGDVLAFAHGHILRVVAACWLGMEPSMGRAFLLAPGGLGLLTWERENPVVGRWDDDGGDGLSES